MNVRWLRIFSASLLVFALAAPAIGVAGADRQHDTLHAQDDTHPHDAHSHTENGKTHTHGHHGVHDHGEKRADALPVSRLMPVRLAHAGSVPAFEALLIISAPSFPQLSRVGFDPPPRAGDLLRASNFLNKAPPALLS